MIFNFLSFLFFIIGFVLAYRLWLAPLLRTRPSFAEFYRITDSFWHAVWLKVAFLKTKLAAAFLMIASALVTLHDFLWPHILTISQGIDWVPVTEKVPGWVWPIASFAIGGLFYWLRHITAKEQEQVVSAVAAGATPEQAVMLVAAPQQDASPPVPDDNQFG